MYQVQKQKGITLIALVITIIILIILAGVAINLTLGENGILTKAKQAKTDYNLAKAKEELELEIANIQIEIMSQEHREATLNDLYARINKDKYTIKLKFDPIATVADVNATPTYSIVNTIGTEYYFTVDSKLVIRDVEIKVLDDEESDNKNYLYNLGRISEEAEQFVGVSDTYAEHTMNSNNIYANVTGTTGYNFTYIGTKNKIDLHDYSKICCLVTTGNDAQGSGNVFRLAINDTQLPTGLEEQYIKELSDTVAANQTSYILEWKIPIEYRNYNYVGFVSTLKDVYVYKIWLEPTNEYIIYNQGQVCNEAEQFVGVSDTYAEHAMNANNIYMDVTGTTGYNLTYIGTKNKIDLHDYSKICCLVTTGNDAQGSGNVFRLAINDTQLPTGLEEQYIKQLSVTVAANQTNYVLEWKIPENYKNANNYIGFVSTLKDVYVYKMWLED